VVIRVIVAMAVLVWAVNVNALTVNTKAQKPKGYGMAGIKDLFSQITTLIDGTKMDNILRDEYGLSNETLNNYASTVAGIESDGGQNLENPDSTAKGVYQFTDAGFKTAVQRAKNVYEAKGYTVPLWLEKAEETGVMGLNEAQQKDLFFANLQQNTVANTTPQYGEIIYGSDMSGVKGFFSTIKFKLSNTSYNGTFKELFSVSTDTVESSY